MIEKYDAHIKVRETFWEWLKLLRNPKVVCMSFQVINRRCHLLYTFPLVHGAKECCMNESTWFCFMMENVSTLKG